ncbi:MAG: ABC transporter substrate-binding protein [Chakrabartia sp.]
MIRSFLSMTITFTLMLSGCNGNDQDSAVAVSVIGAKPKMMDPSRSALDQPSAVLTGAMFQGLVAFNAAGEIEPALAERWIVTDDGLSYIFRIKRARWSDGRPVTAKEVAQSLRAALSSGSRNSLRSHFGAVAEIVAMTDWVIEVRLTSPQPELLPLLAQPEMAVLRAGKGTGPYRLYRAYPNSFVLRPVLPEGLSESEIDPDILRNSERRLRGEKAPAALVRYSAGDVSLVLGGSFDDVPYVQHARIPNDQFRRDLAAGIFGLAVTPSSSILNDRDVRLALAMSIDRQRLVNRFQVNGWRPQETILPGPIALSGNQALPEWAQMNATARLQRGRTIIAERQQSADQRMTVRVAMPNGPGGQLLFAQLSADWSRIGVRAVHVKMGAAADLRLVDMVAPQNTAAWYLKKFMCAESIKCSATTDDVLTRARKLSDNKARAEALSVVDAAVTKDQYFIPLATPLRWSIVSPRLAGYQENVFAVHPLNRLARVGR